MTQHPPTSTLFPYTTLFRSDELKTSLAELPGWEIRDGWLRRTFDTPGFPHTLMLAQTIGYLAEAAWHHPDLKLGYAAVTVIDRKSTRLNSSHGYNSYAVFCL